MKPALSQIGNPKRHALPGEASVTRRTIGSLFIYGFLIAWGLAAMYPLLFMLITSLKKDAELYSAPFALPTMFRWGNFADAWTHGLLGRCALNSLQVTLFSLVLAMALSMACAFAFARINFGPLKTFFWTYVMFGFLVPDSVRFFPLMVFLAKIHLFDSIWALVLIYSAGGIPWNTFFLRAFMERIPRDYEDAAVVDGASIWQVFRHVVLPLSRAPLVTLATFHVMGVWNEFMMAFFLTSSESARTLPVGVRMLQGALVTNQTAVAAGLIIVMIPTALFFVLLQRHIVKGLTAGALVG
ncbi:MAG: carbohydrate ABC transporter permease [Armatimonadota bacterium]|nr:carbohydrate ABC transporter permease [Armatimonadota bacterium]